MATISVRSASLRKLAGLAFVLALACASPGLLLSEDTTMTTYYPAPYGGYNSILTTGDTLLARDGGSVGIGTNSPGSKLDVRGNASIQGSAIVTNDVRGGRVYSNGALVVNGVSCAGGLSCSVSSSGQLLISLNQQPANPTTPPTTNPTTPPSAQCVSNGSCSAAAPACGQITYGTDNCGIICSKTGPACCVSDGSCSAPEPPCEKTTSGTDNCGTPCSKTGVKCSCYGTCSPEECFEASRSCQLDCGPVAFGNLIYRGFCMTVCNTKYLQCPRF